MNAKSLTHRQAATLPRAKQERIIRSAGIHADQNRRRGAKAARGGRQGERLALRKGAWA